MVKRWLDASSPDAKSQNDAFGMPALLFLLASIIPSFAGR
jgi:hypothetical protein